MKRIFGRVSVLLSVALLFGVAVMNYSSPVLATDPTTSVTVTLYASDGTTILAQETVDYTWMMENLPVYGDGVTHYYCQGPTFDDSSFETLWDPDEMVNIDSRDYGAAMGTSVKDLCDLVGGAPDGSEVQIKAIDNFNKWFAAEDVNDPEPEQGEMVITWYTDGTVDGTSGLVPDYSTGIRLLFFAETLNPEDKHVFGIWDMHETLAEDYWHYYYDGKYWPSSSGLSVKWVNEINIYSGSGGQDSYKLSIDIEGDGDTTPVTGEHYYDAGTVVNLEAIPDSGWEFVEWEGDVADNDDDTTTVTMDEDKTVTAIFEEGQYKLTIKIEGQGQTTPSAGSHSYREDKVVNLEAIPDSGWEFVEWEGDVADNDDDTTTVTMDEDKTVTAIFEEGQYKLAIKIEGQGQTTPSAGNHSYREDKVINLEAIPDSGWQFVGWEGDVADNDDDTTTITIDDDKQITALFEEVTEQAAVVTSSPGGESENADQKFPPSASKSDTANWVLVLSIVGGVVVLAGIISLIIISLKRPRGI